MGGGGRRGAHALAKPGTDSMFVEAPLVTVHDTPIA